MDISHEDQKLNQKKFLYALRNTPESVRCQDVLHSPAMKQYCALGLGFHEFGFTDAEIYAMDRKHAEGEDIGNHYFELFSDLTGLKKDVVEGIVGRNDDIDYGTSPRNGDYKNTYTWNEIAEFIEGKVEDA